MTTVETGRRVNNEETKNENEVVNKNHKPNNSAHFESEQTGVETKTNETAEEVREGRKLETDINISVEENSGEALTAEQVDITDVEDRGVDMNIHACGKLEVDNVFEKNVDSTMDKKENLYPDITNEIQEMQKEEQNMVWFSN